MLLVVGDGEVCKIKTKGFCEKIVVLVESFLQTRIDRNSYMFEVDGYLVEKTCKTNTPRHGVAPNLYF